MSSSSSSAVGQAAAPPTGLNFIKGAPLDFAKEFEAGQKVFVLECWATWCGPCRQIIPHMTELAKRMKGHGVEFCGITSEDEAKASKFVDQMGAKMDYTVACDEEDSFQREYMSRFGVGGIPHAFVVGKDGKIAWQGHPADPSFEPAVVSAAQKPGKAPALDVSAMSEAEVSALSVKELKGVLGQHGVDFTGAVEKADLVELVRTKINQTV
jgi:thiol-disulfide isomerase/thioredoxin